jgi:malonyl-CoA O-methyltransferase
VAESAADRNKAVELSGYRLDKRRLRAHFARAARTYDSAAVLQREVADRMLARLEAIRHEPQNVLDAGSGTGYAVRALARRFRNARVTGIDIAHPMLVQARRQTGWFQPKPYVCGDIEAMPFADERFDLILSNLALQWCDPELAVREFLRVLRPGGLLMFTTFGPDTLRELRAAWRAVDPVGVHVHAFYDMHDLGDALLRVGFAEPVMDVERFTLTYPDVAGVLRDLHGIGAHNAARGATRTLTGKRRFAAFRAAYEMQAQEGRIPATYEVVHAHAWAPTTRPGGDRGTVAVPIDQVIRRR